MLIDTHAHINMMVKKTFDTYMSSLEIAHAQTIVHEAFIANVTTLINVGTSLSESINCISLATHYPNIYAVVGIHPNDCTETWFNDFKKITELTSQKEKNRIVGIGECGIDRHYPGYNISRQNDVFKAHIELALLHDLALVVHSRDAYDETLTILDEYKQEPLRGTIHCFSYDQSFAEHVIKQNFVLGIGGTVTYPKNKKFRELVKNIDLKHIVLETDAPFLPIQIMRGKKNHPRHIREITAFIAELRNESFEHIAKQTTKNAKTLFNIEGAS